MRSKRLFLSLVFVLVCGSIAIAGIKPSPTTLKVGPIEIKSRPISFASNKNIQIFDKLKFNGGLVLNSPSKYFGGLSGLALSKDGKRFISVSDGGTWVMGELTYDKTTGRLIGVEKGIIGPLLTLKDGPVRKKRDFDAEAISLKSTGSFFGDAFISFEHNHRIGVFPLSPQGLKAPKRYLPLGKKLKKLHDNAGIEAITYIKGGRLKNALLLLTQSRRDKNGNAIGWVYFPNGKTKKVKFSPPPTKNYRLTDVASLENGDLILLERSYKFFDGIRIRLRYFAGKDLLSKNVMKGRVLLNAHSYSHTLDNMEGLAIAKNKKGDQTITLLSDNNFNGFQRTILLQFILPTQQN